MGLALKIVAAICGSLVVLLALYAGKLLLTEDLLTTRGTFAYYITIRSSNVKNFPLVGVVGEVEYYASCGDGPKPPANGVFYTSDENPQKLKESIEQYLSNRGFVKTEESIHGGTYVQPDRKTSFELTIKSENDRLQRVTAIEYYSLN